MPPPMMTMSAWFGICSGGVKLPLQVPATMLLFATFTVACYSYLGDKDYSEMVANVSHSPIGSEKGQQD